MNTPKNIFSEPEIVTTDELKHRSYVTFYFNDERVREYHAKSIGLDINPNRAKSLDEKKLLLKKLHFELHKALDADTYPSAQETTLLKPLKAPMVKYPVIEQSAISLLFNVMKVKLRSDLSRTYKRDLKSIYRSFRAFITTEEAQGNILQITTPRIAGFLAQFGSSGTYYMNKRRTLGVLFSAVGRDLDKPIKSVKETSKRRVKAHLHQMYSKEQLNPILDYLKQHYYKLYLGCLITYGTWLRPHEEIRLLTVGDFKSNFTEIHLSGSENKGGKVRVVYVPEYIQRELIPVISHLHRGINIFSLQVEPYNYSYFNTQWSRAYKKMFERTLVYENQTIYSFRHTAAVLLYRKTKDVHLLQKLLGHSNIVVTLKYLRSLGELNTEQMRDAAPEL